VRAPPVVRRRSGRVNNARIRSESAAVMIAGQSEVALTISPTSGLVVV
jgi:hypothetical protein